MNHGWKLNLHISSYPCGYRNKRLSMDLCLAEKKKCYIMVVRIWSGHKKLRDSHHFFAHTEWEKHILWFAVQYIYMCNWWKSTNVIIKRMYFIMLFCWPSPHGLGWLKQHDNPRSSRILQYDPALAGWDDWNSSRGGCCTCFSKTQPSRVGMIETQ